MNDIKESNVQEPSLQQTDNNIIANLEKNDPKIKDSTDSRSEESFVMVKEYYYDILFDWG